LLEDWILELDAVLERQELPHTRPFPILGRLASYAGKPVSHASFDDLVVLSDQRRLLS
jgi:hypothetical protein